MEIINIRIFGNNKEVLLSVQKKLSEKLYSHECKCPHCNERLTIYKSIMKFNKLEWNDKID